MLGRARFAVLVACLWGVAGLLSAQEADMRTGDDARAPTINEISNRETSQKTAREKWNGMGRTLPNESSALLRARAIQRKLQMRGTGNSVVPGATGVWVSLGPSALPSDASGSGIQDYGFVTGRATTVAIDPNDPTGNTVFVGGAYAGIWKSTNAGPASASPSTVTWVPLTDAQLTLAIGSVAVQPQASNPNAANSVVLAGTGETDSTTDSYYGLGILRSTNGGQSWALISQDSTKAHSFAGLGFSQIAFSTANPNLVVAAAGSASEGILEGLENPVAVNRGLYYSTDAGADWQMGVVTDSGASISPDSATAVVYNAAAAEFYAAIRNHGFYSSPDGINWSRLANQPGTGLTAGACPATEITPSACPIYRGEIAVVQGRVGPSNHGELYVWYVDANSNDQGIWESLDGGNSWTQINDSGVTNCGDVFGGCGTEDGTFNLTLAAVPNGGATDLYAGAINIYKCEINTNYPSCNGTGSNTFLNLTHAYGCSAIAKVHPAQHAMDFLALSSDALMYFANDGGVYRSLDAYTGLTTGTCGQSNQFDDLNQTLGPMTQFVSIAQSSTDANLILGGTEDNGAPSTASSQGSGTWVNVDAGDNGFTAVSPANKNEWFVSTPPDSISGVNLFACANGVNCHTQDFQNDQIADSNSVAGDIGPYYLPFILDPQNSAELILGTCRIWRGSASGGAFSVLSPDFETGGTGSCSGDEINMVRSIAAGGLKEGNGYSQVIYAGTNGEGLLISTTPTGGHVWVTTNADGGPLTWTDVTQGINPLNFPISSIALDSTDPLGNTAYVTIMGFHASHVWKTTNAGASWADYTANLPDAPVNSVVVDSGASLSNGTVYIGTDVGVFASSTASANWTEVGPTAGQAGSLPNVAVTSLQIFNSGGLKRLRAATYGRGIWEWNLVTTPDFQFNVSNNPVTIFPAQTGVFSGTITALNTYSSNVNLSCVAGITGPPPSCSVNPLTVLPSASGAGFSLSASGPVGDYQFNLQGIGTDSATVTHEYPLLLHVVDFSIGTPSTSGVTVEPGSMSAPVSFQVGTLGSFSGAVALSCSNLPPGVTCNFQPSATVSPTSTNPVSVTVTFTAPITAVPGSFAVTINAAVSGAPTKTQSFTLTVSAAPGFALAIANPSMSAAVNTPATFNGTLTAINGYGSSVALSCGSNAPPTCTTNPANVIPSATGMPFTVTVSSGAAQSYSFNIVATGNDSAATTHSVPVVFTATTGTSFDFMMNVAPATASVTAGNTATLDVTVNSTTGSFPNAVEFSCSGLPSLSNCAFSPAQLATGVSGPQTINLMIETEGPSTSSSGTIQGTPPGPYSVTVTATSGALTHSATIGLTVTSSSTTQSFDFNIGANPTTPSVAAGSATTVAVTVTSTTGVPFPDLVSFTCSNLPALTTCTFNPTQVGSGDSSPQTVSLTINTTAAVAASAASVSPLFASFAAVGLLFIRPRKLRVAIRGSMLTLLIMALVSCGGGLQGNGGGSGSGSPGTPPGTYNDVTVNATCGSVMHSVPLTLTVTP